MKHWFGKLKNAIPFFKRKKTDPIDFIDLVEDQHAAWWGTFAVGEEQSRYAKINNVVLCIDHYNQEWHIAHYREGQDKARSKTIATHVVQGEIILKPMLPDRPVLLLLENALLLPAKSHLPLYVSTSLFIRIEIGNPPIFLDEVSSEILSDTWYGKNTQAGELCYFSTHLVAHRLDELSRDNTEVQTPIIVHNQSSENVFLKEIKIPAPFLSIFCDQQNHLWTEQLTITFINHEVSNTLIEKGPPKGLKNITLLSAPRHPVKGGFISLFNPR